MAQMIVNKTLSEGMVGEFVDASPRRTFKAVVHAGNNAYYGSAFFKTEDGWSITGGAVANAPMAFSVNPKEDCLKSLRGMNDEGDFVAKMNNGNYGCALCTMGRIWLAISFVKDGGGSIVPITDIDEARNATIIGYSVASGSIAAITGEASEAGGENIATINGFLINRINALETDAGLYLCEVEITNPVYVEFGE